MNSINLCGRMVKDPELRRTDTGKAVCSFNLAVKRPKNAEKTDFIACVVWQQGAEYLCKYGHKGDVVTVNGYLYGREWTSKEGEKRMAWEVNADSVELVGGKKTEGQQSYQPTAPQQSYPQYPQQNYPQYPAQNFEVLNDPNIQLPF